jgi:hypothetical protein
LESFSAPKTTDLVSASFKVALLSMWKSIPCPKCRDRDHMQGLQQDCPKSQKYFISTVDL